MKLIRFGPNGNEHPGLVDSTGTRRDCSDHVSDWSPAALSNGALDQGRELADNGQSLSAVPEHARWGPPIARPGKIIAIGLNYADHAAETGAAKPEKPVIFFKSPTAVTGPYDQVLIPRMADGSPAKQTDWEVELGVVIAKTARYLDSPEQAADHIAGYLIVNDVSERHFQKDCGGQWVKGKSADTFAPLGPLLVTPDELGEVSNLAMTTHVDQTLMQQGNTKTMIFDVPFIVHHLSRFMTLEPGDLITTGTPPGVAMARTPPPYLREGQTMRLEIEGLGIQQQTLANA